MPDQELKELIEQQNTAFEKFKKANNDRLVSIEEKGKADPLLEEKVNKANDDLSAIASQLAEIEKKLNRPGAGGDGESKEVSEHKAAYGKFMRKGTEDGLRDLERKALNVTTDADGGYAVPEELDRNILQLMQDVSPMRAECTVRQIGGATYKQLVNLGGAASGWVDEDDARTETDTPTLGTITPVMGEIYANPSATQTMLDDVFFNAESWLSDEVARTFAEAEGAAFVSGDGSKKPKGILAYTSATTADSSRAFGTLQHIAAAGTAAITSDELLDMVYALKKGMRMGAKWMLNSMSLKYIRKLQDNDGNYLWQPGIQAGQPTTLMGYGIAENEDMADIAASAVPIMFGNFKRGYLIVDRMGIRTLRDPYTNKPYVHFYTTKRVGGCLWDSNAIKLLQMAAS